MQEALTAYLAHLVALGRQPSTVASAEARLQYWLAALAQEGCTSIPDVRASDLDRILGAWVGRGLARETLRARRASIAGFFAWLAETGSVLLDPTRDLELRAVSEPDLPPAPLSESEVAALLSAVPTRTVVNLRNRAHLELLYSAGLRLNESLDLDLDAVDVQRGCLLVRGKGGHERLVPLLAGTMGILQDYLAVRRHLVVGPDRGDLFLGRRGKRVDGCGFRQWIKAHAARVLGPDRPVHPHLFRHSIAVHLLRGGVDIRHVQEFLGHASLETTRIYLRLVPGHLREDYDAAMPHLAGDLPD